MQVEESYQRYLDKVEKNGLNDNASTDRGRFVRLRNENANILVQLIIGKKTANNYRYIQNLLIPDKRIWISKKRSLTYDFELPKDYFDLANVYAKASQGECLNKTLYLFEIKEENKNEILQDDFQKPSFLAREAPYTITSDSINVFYDNFKVDAIYTSYYRYPTQIRLIDPSDSDSKFDENFQTDFDDQTEDIILSLCAGQFALNNSDPIYQALQQNAITKI